MFHDLLWICCHATIHDLCSFKKIYKYTSSKPLSLAALYSSKAEPELIIYFLYIFENKTDNLVKTPVQCLKNWRKKQKKTWLTDVSHVNDGEFGMLRILEIFEAGGILGDEEGLELDVNEERILKQVPETDFDIDMITMKFGVNVSTYNSWLI